MSAIVTRAGKGSPLTNTELDGNFTELDAAMQRRSGLTNIIALSLDRMWRDVYAGGDRPSFMNQQWGGAQWGTELVDGATGNLYKFDVATGYIQDDGTASFGNTTSIVVNSTGFKVSDAVNLAACWMKLFKVGSPTDNLTAYISSDDGTGKPSGSAITNGTGALISGKVITSKTDGEFYRLTFPTPPALTPNVQYHIVLGRSGAVDAANYFSQKVSNNGKYPHGQLCQATSSPVWTAFPTIDACFLIEAVQANQFFRSGGQFGGKLVFTEGAPLDQSKALVNPLKNFFDSTGATLLHRVSSCVKGKPIADCLYGLDHDRILLMCDATTGYASIRLWKQDGTLLTVTGNTDVSGASLSDVAINFRAMGDGADYLKLIVNGAQQAALTNQTITFDPLMRELGHRWLGGGFAAAPTWTQKLDMSSLPSANGWTWTGTGTEANCMSVSGGKLYQNKNGYGATDSGYYVKIAIGLSNSSGWIAEAKMRSASATNTIGVYPAYMQVSDGSKTVYIAVHEYFVAIYSASGATPDFIVQGDFRTQENVFKLCGKGSDYWLYIDGKLAIDGTGKLLGTTASNLIAFGDVTTTSGENADAVYDYVAYYNSGAILPQIATGMALHEYAHWSGDKSSYLPNLYNAGSPVSVKQFAGLSRNYVDVVEWSETRYGVTSGPITSSASFVTAQEMECFVIGDKFRAEAQTRSTNGTAGVQNFLNTRIDGATQPIPVSSGANVASANYEVPLKAGGELFGAYGLHKVDGVVAVSSGTMTLVGQGRSITVRGAK